MKPLNEREFRKVIRNEIKIREDIKTKCEKFENRKDKTKGQGMALGYLLSHCEQIHSISTLKWVLEQITKLKKQK